MELTNKHNLPKPIVSAVSNDQYWNPADIGTTTLISPPRIRVLKKRNHLTEDVSDLIYPLCGNNTHAILERITDINCLKEWRFYLDVFGWLISGQIDLYEYDTRTLSDYKLTSMWSFIHGAKPEHIAQMNINKYLIEKSPYKDFLPIEKLQIVMIFRDWSKIKASYDASYLQSQVGVQDIPIWPVEIVEQYVFMRVLLHQEAEETPSDELLECTQEERWEKPTKYAVMKKGRKSAIRVLDENYIAEQYIEDNNLDDKHYIDVRKGESTRCKHYCYVNQFCNQYQKTRG